MEMNRLFRGNREKNVETNAMKNEEKIPHVTKIVKTKDRGAD
jgi:hypothetical protein